MDADGLPVAGAFVTVVSGTAAVPEIALVTGDDGQFSIGLPSGCFRLRANTADDRAGEAEIDTGADAFAERDEEIVIRVG